MVHGGKAGESSIKHFQEHRMGKLLGRRRGRQSGKVSLGEMLPDLRSLGMNKCWVFGKERRAVQTENQHNSRHMEICKGVGTGGHSLVAGTLGMKVDMGKRWWRGSQKERESHFRFLRLKKKKKKLTWLDFKTWFRHYRVSSESQWEPSRESKEWLNQSKYRRLQKAKEHTNKQTNRSWGMELSGEGFA